MYTLDSLPVEILHIIANYLKKPCDINSLASVNGAFYSALNNLLYRNDALNGKWALEWASSHGEIQTAQKSIDAILPCRYRLNILHNGLICAAFHGHTNVASLILSQEGVNPNFLSEHDYDIHTPLVAASERGHLELVKLLLSTKGVDPNLDSHGWPALVTASKKGHIEVVKLLLDAPDIDPECRSHFGDTPLYAAVDSKSTTVAKYLLLHPTIHVDVNAVTRCRKSLGGNDNKSVLIAAAHENLPDIVEQLLAAPNIKVNHRDSFKRTALHEAAENGSCEIVKNLLEHQADPDPVDCFNESPLFLAAGKGHLSVVKLLLEAGAEPNHVCDNSYTPLATAKRNGHTDVMQALLDTGRVFLSSLEKVHIEPRSSRRMTRARYRQRPRPKPIQYTSDGLAISPSFDP
jgi:ankyrin repeat protein